jgi:hypothetical protein
MTPPSSLTWSQMANLGRHEERSRTDDGQATLSTVT